MQLVSLCFENYKPFAERHELVLKPLTILVGRNGSGKSAVLRLVPLICHALVERREPGLALTVDKVRYGNSIADLVHGRLSHGTTTVGASFQAEAETWSFEATIQPFLNKEKDQLEQVISHFISKTNGSPDIELRWLRRESQQAGETIYQVITGEEIQNAAISFQGLLPEPSPLSKQWQARLADFFHDRVHLGPLRDYEERFFSRSEGAIGHIDIRGKNAAQLLEKERETLLEKVRTWFAQEELGHRMLEIKMSGPVFEIYLKRGEVASHLNDVGQGMFQAFPIVVQRCRDPKHTAVEIIEEPESHLHPSAHGAMADLFWRAIGNGPQMLVETHSEVFLLRVRRAIAEGQIKKDDVALYFLDDDDHESEITELQLKATGEVGNWPAQLFSEDYEEALKIRQSQRKRQGE